MFKKILLLNILTISIFGYDFGAVLKVKVADIPKGKRLLVQFGKTECVWCEYMGELPRHKWWSFLETPNYCSDIKRL